MPIRRFSPQSTDNLMLMTENPKIFQERSLTTSKIFVHRVSKTYIFLLFNTSSKISHAFVGAEVSEGFNSPGNGYESE